MMEGGGMWGVNAGGIFFCSHITNLFIGKPHNSVRRAYSPVVSSRLRSLGMDWNTISSASTSGFTNNLVQVLAA